LKRGSRASVRHFFSRRMLTSPRLHQLYQRHQLGAPSSPDFAPRLTLHHTPERIATCFTAIPVRSSSDVRLPDTPSTPFALSRVQSQSGVWHCPPSVKHLPAVSESYISALCADVLLIDHPLVLVRQSPLCNLVGRVARQQSDRCVSKTPGHKQHAETDRDQDRRTLDQSTWLPDATVPLSEICIARGRSVVSVR
jgi:hypothetical protein